MIVYGNACALSVISNRVLTPAFTRYARELFHNHGYTLQQYWRFACVWWHDRYRFFNMTITSTIFLERCILRFTYTHTVLRQYGMSLASSGHVTTYGDICYELF